MAYVNRIKAIEEAVARRVARPGLRPDGRAGWTPKAHGEIQDRLPDDATEAEVQLYHELRAMDAATALEMLAKFWPE